jgi:beta-lactam-binding protein with PASTA domain
VGQKPLAGSTVKTGRRVNLLVSKGPMIVNVPFLTQMSLSQGMKILSSLGVTSTAVESLRSSTIPPGKIIGTEPGPGLDIPLGTQLKIYVSSGMSGIFLMPSLVGLLTNIAIDSVSYNGLILGNIQTIPSDEEQGLVIIQYPEDGMKVKTGDTVRLIVSQGRR